MTIKEWKDKANDLVSRSFTEDFLKGHLCIDVLFDRLEFDKHSLDELDYYEDGEVLTLKVELGVSENADVVNLIIKDLKVYQEYVIFLFSNIYDVDTEVDLIGVINAMSALHHDIIHYDKEREEFYYYVGDEDDYDDEYYEE